MEIPAVIWGPLLPLLLVAGAALVVLVVDLFLEGPERELLAWLSLLGLVTGGFASAALWGSEASTLGDRFVVDNYALFFNLIFCGGTALTVLMSIDSVRLEETGGEYYPLLLFAVTGMITMAAANDLIVLFLGLEVMSIAVYVLTGIFRNEPRSSEAALKYFLLGAFATGFLLFGIALLYGATGTTRLDLIANRLGGPERELAMLGAGLLLIGFGFKVAAVPFHVWTPDVYEGAPTSVTALMAVGVKAAAFAAFARVFGSALVSLSDDLSGLLWVLAAATMTVGNVLAIAQSNIKRMLAYSSIAHAGYLLMGLVAATPQAGSALLFYLFAYAVMNLGAFAVVLALGETDGSGATHEDIESYSGIGFRQPLLGMAMAAFMLSLAGVPPLVGFTGKFYLFGAAIEAGYVGLAIVGVLNSVVSAYYYLWVIVTMYMKEGTVDPTSLAERPYLAATIGISFAATLLVGVFPGLVFALARSGFFSLG